MDAGERFGGIGGHVSDLVDVDLLKEGLVHQPTGGVCSRAVECSWILDQSDRLPEKLSADGQLCRDVRHSLLRLALLNMNLVELYTDLLLRQHAVGGQINKALLFDFKLLDLPTDLGVDVPHSPLLVGECPIDALPDICHEVRRQVECLVMPFQSVFNAINGQVRERTEAFFSSSTDVVVIGATAANSLGEDHATGPPRFVATPTKEHALRKVLMDTIPLAAAAAAIDHFLDLIK